MRFLSVNCRPHFNVLSKSWLWYLNDYKEYQQTYTTRSIKNTNNTYATTTVAITCRLILSGPLRIPRVIVLPRFLKNNSSTYNTTTITKTQTYTTRAFTNTHSTYYQDSQEYKQYLHHQDYYEYQQYLYYQSCYIYQI